MQPQRSETRPLVAGGSAVEEIGYSLTTWRDQQRGRLVLFSWLDAMLTLGAAVFVAAVYALAAPQSYLLACSVAVAIAGAMMFIAATNARAGRIDAAVGWLALGNWTAIMTGAVLASAVWPIYPIAALFPAVVAASYVRQDQFRRYLVTSVVVATVATVLGLFSDATGIRDDVDGAIIDGLQAFFVPTMTAVLGFLALQNFGRVRAMVAGLTAAHESARFQANELLASRSRMLQATNRERRRIERDLHDGTQQHFVAMGLRLSTLRASMPADDALLAQVDRLRDDVREAQRNLRDLTAAIYPPTLTQHGLSAAVRFIADRFTSNVTTSIEEVGRCDPEVEAAVYFTCLEALQNAAKHAGANAKVHIELGREGRDLAFSITDDGVGFSTDPAATGGLVNMCDRIGAVLGTLDVTSSPGLGTAVSGVVPLVGAAN